MIRQLPAGFALVIRGDCAPVIARLPRAWRNRAYRRARRHPQPPAAAWLPAATRPEFVIPDHLPASAWDDHASSPWSPPMTNDPLTAALGQLAAHGEQISGPMPARRGTSPPWASSSLGWPPWRPRSGRPWPMTRES